MQHHNERNFSNNKTKAVSITLTNATQKILIRALACETLITS